MLARFRAAPPSTLVSAPAAARWLTEQGYTRIRNTHDGIAGWIAAAHAVSRD